MNLGDFLKDLLGKLKPGDLNSLIDALIFLVFSIMKSIGMNADEAKQKFYEKVDEIEATPDLPMSEG